MAKKVDVQELLKRNIRWQYVGAGHWAAVVEGVEWRLRMNDWPDQPMYTVLATGVAVDIEAAPTEWDIEATPSRPEFQLTADDLLNMTLEWHEGVAGGYWVAQIGNCRANLFPGEGGDGYSVLINGYVKELASLPPCWRIITEKK